MWRRETRRRAGDGCSAPRGVVVADAVAVAAGFGDQRRGHIVVGVRLGGARQ